jgi:hypothetical protein
MIDINLMHLAFQIHPNNVLQNKYPVDLYLDNVILFKSNHLTYVSGQQL